MTVQPFRDATFSKQTRDTLAEFGPQVRDLDLRAAIADVVDSWDGNDATEIYLDPAEAHEPAEQP
jgi:hypothetical protein